MHVESAANDADQDKSLPPTPGQKKQSGSEEKQELMDRMQPPKGTRPTDLAKQKGDKWVKDPVTGEQVLLRNPKFEGTSCDALLCSALHRVATTDFRGKGLDNEALDPSSEKPGPALKAPPDPAHQDQRYTAPAPAEIGNICLQQFPPTVDPVDVSKAKSILRSGAIATTGACAIVWYFVVFGNHLSWLAWFFRNTLLGCVVAIAWTGSENAGRKMEKELERIRMNMHRQRGEQHSPPTPESVEWMNAFIKVVWGLVNPEMFVPMVDVSFLSCFGIVIINCIL